MRFIKYSSNTYQQVNDTLHNVSQQQNNIADSVLMMTNLIVFHVFIDSQKA